MAYISFRNVVKKYGENEVLKDITFDIEKGEFVTLLGASGCGKSTLLRCMAGLEEVTSGEIIMDCRNITNLPANKRNVGMVFQQYSLFPNMTAEQNVAFGLQMMKVNKTEIKRRVGEVMELVELTGKEKEYPCSLSGGQQQRVALARSIVTEPKVLLLDEPLSAIDAKLRKALQLRIKEIHAKLGLTVIFVTHDQDEAMEMSDRIQLFHQGRIEQEGSPVSMYTAPRSRFAASFIGNYNIIDAEKFAKLIGDEKVSDDIAIRPETIQITSSPSESDTEYHFCGKIRNNTPRGNVLRYTIDVQGVLLNVDVLFRSFTLFSDGTEVCLSVPKKDCLSVA